REYDPQPFHVDETAAKDSFYGGLIASGWQTVGVMMRLMWDTFLSKTASLGSPGCDEIRWLKPVHPGDTLRARFTVTDVIPSRSKPDRGIVRTLTEMLNQHGDVVMTVRGIGMSGRDPAKRTERGRVRAFPARRRGMRLPERVTICEVGTRDGFQIEPDFIPTEQKIEVVNLLSAAGLPRIEATSFVHPKAVP